ncbi:MAG: hypothetical protein JNK56_28970 [Myxococcales bacterium]|nr:hypothetical protein [Myxococcales bacterium]
MTTADQEPQVLPETPAAVTRLVANHREFLGFLQSRVGSRALAEDILQDAFVARLADNLKPEYAEALRRIEVDGVAVKDYAVEAGITSNNAAVRVFRAREALKKQVVRSCGTCADHGCLDCTCAAGHCGA